MPSIASPSREDPLLILAMDHRESFGRTLFGVRDDNPGAAQRAAMTAAKRLIYDGLARARAGLPRGRAGVLVDERYGQPVIRAAQADGMIVSVPVERSGQNWFEPEWGLALAGVRDREPPGLREGADPGQPGVPLRAAGTAAAHAAVRQHRPARPGRSVDCGAAGPGDRRPAGRSRRPGRRYDRDLRPSLVIRVIADHQAAGIEPAIWKVDGLESADAARAVVAQIRAGGRPASAIVLGRDAPAARLDYWLEVAAPVDGFVGFAIGRSIWEQPIAGWVRGDTSQDETTSLIARRYLRFARHYCAASDQSRQTDRAGPSPACPAKLTGQMHSLPAASG